jgi:hypothetical protein
MRENMRNIAKLPRVESQILASKNNATKMGKSNLGRKHIKKLCPYCNKEFGPAPFAKFHNEKCKLKSSQS